MSRWTVDITAYLPDVPISESLLRVVASRRRTDPVFGSSTAMPVSRLDSTGGKLPSPYTIWPFCTSQYGASEKSPNDGAGLGCDQPGTCCPVVVSTARMALLSSDFFWYVTQTRCSAHGCTYLISSPGLSCTGGYAWPRPARRYRPSWPRPDDAS